MKIIKRREAKAAGLKFYFTGKPCPKGHVVERYVSTGRCMECTRESCSEWREANPEKVRECARASVRKWREDNPEKNRERKRKWNQANPEKNRKWRKANSERVRELMHKWREANRERIRESNREWRKANLDRKNAHQARRRARKLNATPIWACKEAINAIYSLAKAQGLHVDHIIPLKNPLVCGLHVHYNLQLLPPSENIRKNNKFDG